MTRCMQVKFASSTVAHKASKSVVIEQRKKIFINIRTGNDRNQINFPICLCFGMAELIVKTLDHLMGN